MAICTLSETDDSGNIPWRCVAAGSDGVGVNEFKHPEMKLCKRVGSMWASCRRLQESTWVNVLFRDGELECPNNRFSVVFLLFTENLPDRVRFREATALNTWKCLSDTVPGALFELVCHYLQAGSSRSVYVPCTPVDPCWKHKLYINVVATKHKLYTMVANNMKATVYQHSISS